MQNTGSSSVQSNGAAKSRVEGSKHTPGPWRIWPEGSAQITALVPNDAFGEIECGVARCFAGHSDADANARLIAAAPDLLAALQDILNYGLPQPGAYTRAAAAVAKALPPQPRDPQVAGEGSREDHK